MLQDPTGRYVGNLNTMAKGCLIICPTPLGNLGDITLRALEVLKAADTICAEDTRVTAKLLAAYAIEKRIERLDESAISKQADDIIRRVGEGETIAYCSDAGMPGVADPGLRLVEAARAAKVPVEVLPGPSASIAAYVASGFTCPRFYFGGFFPRKPGERQSLLEQVRPLHAVLIFYESPRRLVSALGAIAEAFPDREVAVCRELTKLHEEVIRACSTAVYEAYLRREQESPIKGEVVIVVDTASTEEQERSAEKDEQAARARAAELKGQGGYSAKDIAKLLQREFGLPRNKAYEIAVGPS